LIYFSKKSVIFGLTFGLNHAVLEGIAFFLMSQSAGELIIYSFIYYLFPFPFP